jgi:hypothetical protein
MAIPLTSHWLASHTGCGKERYPRTVFIRPNRELNIISHTIAVTTASIMYGIKKAIRKKDVKRCFLFRKLARSNDITITSGTRTTTKKIVFKNSTRTIGSWKNLT